MGRGRSMRYTVMRGEVMSKRGRSMGKSVMTVTMNLSKETKVGCTEWQKQLKLLKHFLLI